MDALIATVRGLAAISAASQTARASRGSAGFTLIEILVVLAIVAVMVLAVGLSVDSGGPSRRVAVEAERLVALIELACDESAQLGQDTGVRFDKQGYRFVRAVGREWQPRTSDALRARRLPDGMRLSVHIGERALELDGVDDRATGTGIAAAANAAATSTDLVPHLTCDVDGVLTAADAHIEIKAGERSASLTIGEDGRLRVANSEQAA